MAFRGELAPVSAASKPREVGTVQHRPRLLMGQVTVCPAVSGRSFSWKAEHKGKMCGLCSIRLTCFVLRDGLGFFLKLCEGRWRRWCYCCPLVPSLLPLFFLLICLQERFHLPRALGGVQNERSCCKFASQIKRVTGILWGLLVFPNLHNKNSEIRYERSVTVMMV